LGEDALDDDGALEAARAGEAAEDDLGHAALREAAGHLVAPDLRPRVHAPIIIYAALALGIALAPAPAGAQADARSEALRLALEAHTLYEAGEHERSVELLLRAYDLHPEPLLLYNLGRAYEGLGRIDEALDVYGRYLEAEPDAPRRGAVEQSIETLRAMRAERERLAAERDRAEAERERTLEIAIVARAEAAERESAALEAWGWGLGASGAIVLAAAFVLGGASLAREGDALATDVHADRYAAAQEANALAISANVSFATGGSLLLTAVPWLLTVLLAPRAAGRWGIAF
jgi:tetratricopeptide (TPR) repeat protein